MERHYTPQALNDITESACKREGALMESWTLVVVGGLIHYLQINTTSGTQICVSTRDLQKYY